MGFPEYHPSVSQVFLRFYQDHLRISDFPSLSQVYLGHRVFFLMKEAKEYKRYGGCGG
jgi:hypothetical protein